MRFSSTFAAGVLLASGASAENYLGFNSGATKDDRSAKFKSDFEAEFKAAQNLQNSPGQFNAVRLYTNIQAYSKDDPIEAFEAAISTNTSLLLGIWASGTTSIGTEITALKKAVAQHGSAFTDLVIGISIGSEDLYRDSETGRINEAGIGAGPDTILGFIKTFKSALASTPLGSKPVGHVDTWDVWPNATNKAVIDAVDFIGVNEFPYYETGKGNSIKNSGALFDRAYDTVLAVAGGKPVWVTETGWPYTGPDWDEAEATVENAKYYWNEVGCRRLFGKTTAFWYALRDSNPDNKMKFAISNNLSTKARFDLTCPKTFDTPSGTSSSATGSATGSATSTQTRLGASATESSSTTPTGTRSSSGDTSADASTEPSSTSSPDSGSGASSVNIFSAVCYATVALAGSVFFLF